MEDGVRGVEDGMAGREGITVGAMPTLVVGM
jgi:hypothetical protein